MGGGKAGESCVSRIYTRAGVQPYLRFSRVSWENLKESPGREVGLCPPWGPVRPDRGRQDPSLTGKPATSLFLAVRFCQSVQATWKKGMPPARVAPAWFT